MEKIKGRICIISILFFNLFNFQSVWPFLIYKGGIFSYLYTTNIGEIIFS
jgi:hypothetical protein